MKSVIIYTFAEVLKTNPPSFTGRKVVVVLPGNANAIDQIVAQGLAEKQIKDCVLLSKEKGAGHVYVIDSDEMS